MKKSTKREKPTVIVTYHGDDGYAVRIKGKPDPQMLEVGNPLRLLGRFVQMFQKTIRVNTSLIGITESPEGEPYYGAVTITSDGRLCVSEHPAHGPYEALGIFILEYSWALGMKVEWLGEERPFTLKEGVLCQKDQD